MTSTKIEQPPKFTVGQTVYYPALILGHDGAVSRCEVDKLNVDYIGTQGTQIGFKKVTDRVTIWGYHNPREVFPTRAEAVAKLRAKLETRISYLTTPLEAIK